MAENRKSFYEAPSTTVLEVKTEEIVCASPDYSLSPDYSKSGYGDVEEI